MAVVPPNAAQYSKAKVGLRVLGRTVVRDELRLYEMGYDDDTTHADDVPSSDKLLAVNGRPVALLDGPHRVAALKRLVSKTGAGKEELHWPCNFYDCGMPFVTGAGRLQREQHD